MGKFSLLLVLGAILGGSIMMHQTNSTSVLSVEKHADRQEEILAREIARSGHNQQLYRVREMERDQPDIKTEKLVEKVNSKEKESAVAVNLVNTLTSLGSLTSEWGKDDDDDDDEKADKDMLKGMLGGLMGTTVTSEERTGEFQGGGFGTAVGMSGASAFRVTSVGTYGSATHVITSTHVRRGTLVVADSSTFKATFIESQAGYCSAIYLQRTVLDGSHDNGHGNNVDGVDSSNPSGSKLGLDLDPLVDDETKVKKSAKVKYVKLEPELIFASGKNRDGAASNFETVITPGTRLNFFLAVDKDCSEKGRTDLELKDKKYDYYHEALEDAAGSLDEMAEGKYAMIQQNPIDGSKWRIAFEDLKSFSDKQHDDIKANSYGDGKWLERSKKVWSYGGTGWKANDAWGYYRLSDYGNLPDFSDQVFEIVLTQVNPSV